MRGNPMCLGPMRLGPWICPDSGAQRQGCHAHGNAGADRSGLTRTHPSILCHRVVLEVRSDRWISLCKRRVPSLRPACDADAAPSAAHPRFQTETQPAKQARASCANAGRNSGAFRSEIGASTSAPGASPVRSPHRRILSPASAQDPGTPGNPQEFGWGLDSRLRGNNARWVASVAGGRGSAAADLWRARKRHIVLIHHGLSPPARE